MSNKKALYLQKGQSIMEVVIALALISVVLITLVAMAALSIKASVFSRNQTQAQRFTQQASEWLQSEKDASWTVFQGHAATINWCMTNLSWSNTGTCGSTEVVSGTIFLRNLKFTNNADGSIQADISTSWTDAQGTHTAPTSIIFTNWK